MLSTQSFLCVCRQRHDNGFLTMKKGWSTATTEVWHLFVTSLQISSTDLTCSWNRSSRTDIAGSLLQSGKNVSWYACISCSIFDQLTFTFNASRYEDISIDSCWYTSWIMVIVVYSRRSDHILQWTGRTLSSWIQLRHASLVIEVEEFLTLSLRKQMVQIWKSVY